MARGWRDGVVGASVAATVLLTGCSAGGDDAQPAATTAGCAEIRDSVQRLSAAGATPTPTPGLMLPSPPSAEQSAEAKVKVLTALQLVVDHPECYDAESVARAKVGLKQLGG